MRLDIEFVYDPNSNKINIVQARPIPEDFKLPETDMNAVAVIAARAAKFFVNKLTAGEKNKIKEKKVKKQKKDKDRSR